MTRSEVLSKADSYVNGDREQDYGSPESNFQTIADLWAVYLQASGVAIDFLEPHDVAAMLALLKIARIASGHAKADNWIDLAGYAACGGEIQSVSVNPVTVAPEKRMPADYVTPITDKPVEPWGDEDERRMNEWISVNERLPESGIYLIAFVEQERQYVERLYYSTLCGWMMPVAWQDEGRIDAITHWMPLPEPPKEE